MAWNMPVMVRRSIGLCSVSTVSQSQPCAASDSATIASPSASHTPTTGLPALSFRFTSFVSIESP